MKLFKVHAGTSCRVIAEWRAKSLDDIDDLPAPFVLEEDRTFDDGDLVTDTVRLSNRWTDGGAFAKNSIERYIVRSHKQMYAFRYEDVIEFFLASDVEVV